MVLSAVRVNALKQPTKYAIIFLHGLGDSGAGWLFLADEARAATRNRASEFYGKFDHVRFIFPNAPSAPVTVNGGMPMPSWFDIFALGSDPEAESDAREDTQGFLRSVETVNRFIDEVVQELGIPAENIVLGGFSQGAALALAASALLQGENRRVAGFVSLSGFLRVKSEILKTVHQKGGADKLTNFGVPVLHCHGDADPVVAYEFGTKTKDFFKKELGYPSYKFLKFSGLGHSVAPETITQVFKFLASVLPEDK